MPWVLPCIWYRGEVHLPVTVRLEERRAAEATSVALVEGSSAEEHGLTSYVEAKGLDGGEGAVLHRVDDGDVTWPKEVGEDG